MKLEINTVLIIVNLVVSSLTFICIVFPIIFAGVKRFLDRKSIFNKLSNSSKIRLVKQLWNAVDELSAKRIGALITIENKDNLDKLRTDGIVLDAHVSSDLIISIFQKNSPLHDGAIIIRNNRVFYAATYYKITKRSVTNNFGSRHRAALGISEMCDAITIVVSEEKGTILFSKKNKIEYVTSKNFQEKLVEYLD